MSHYLAIDVETSGPGVHSHRMIALGAAVILLVVVAVQFAG